MVSGTAEHSPLLFAGLEEEERRLLEHAPARTCRPGEVVIAEGELNRKIYWVEEGAFSVWKGPVGSSDGVEVAVLRAGECFGEMSVLRDGPTSASLVALEPSTLRELELDQVPEDRGIQARFTLNVARTLVHRLTLTTERLEAKHAAERAAHHRLTAALMLVGQILITLSLYVFLLPIAAWLEPFLVSDSLLSFGFIVLLTGMTGAFHRSSGLPSREFGLSRTGWPRQLWRGTLWSLPWMALFLGLKAGWVLLHPDEYRLFEPERAMSVDDAVEWGPWAAVLAIYCVLTFAQEYVRAVVQGALALFYRSVGEPDRWKSLLIANIVFAILHVHLSPIFAMLAFAGGLLWGWILKREGSYLAAAASHVLLGAWVVFLLGVPY